MLEPELETLRAALERLHARILYDAMGVEHIGYSETLFRRAAKRPENRTLADILVWILQKGGRLRAVQILGGKFVGPTLSLRQLKPRLSRLDPADLAELGSSEAAAVRVLRGLFEMGPVPGNI